MNNKNTTPLLNALLPVAAAIIYVLLGYFFKARGWAIGWIVFLLIPIITSAVTAHKTKNPSAFLYPVLVTAIFLSAGLIFHVWHPTWILFVTIPAYYSICDYIKQKRYKKAIESSDTEPFTPAPPPVAPAGAVPPYMEYPSYPQYTPPYAPQKKSNTPLVVVCVILSIVLVVGAVGAVGAYTILKADPSSFSSWFEFEEDGALDGYTEVNTSTEISTDNINSIEVDWINGNVKIDYYEGDKIYIEEIKKTDKKPMCYKVEDGVLKISEYAESKIINNNASKDLTVKIPVDFKTVDFEIDVVSANVSASGIKTSDFEINTVSGNAEIKFAVSPQKIETDSVSGNVKLCLPKDVSGYTALHDSISGKFLAPDFDGALRFGDGSVVIKCESASGDVTISKAEAVNT